MELDRALNDPTRFFRTRDALTPFLWLGPLWFFLISHLYDPHAAFSRERTLFGLALATAISLVPYLGVVLLRRSRFASARRDPGLPVRAHRIGIRVEDARDPAVHAARCCSARP